MFDVLIVGGNVYDGPGAGPVPADVGVCGDRVAAVGRGLPRKAGAVVDIVVFDPATVADRATFADPHQPSAGVSDVLVNGKVTISGGAFTGEFAGRALAGPGAQR